MRVWRWLRRKRVETTFTSYADLADIFDREWVKRIWTYQEVLLAAHPIVVCSGLHLERDRFEGSIIFLSNPGINDGGHGRRIPNFELWTQVVNGRGQILDKLQTHSENERTDFSKSRKAVEKYRNFIRRTMAIYMSTRIFLRVLQTVLAIALGSSVSWGSPFAFGFDTDNWRTLLPIFCINFMVASLLGLDMWMNGPSWVSFKPLLINLEVPTEALQNNFADVISSRKATNPKDKAFGIQGVMQIFASNSFPAPDYNNSLNNIYKNLTLTAMEITKSLQCLLPAALLHAGDFFVGCSPAVIARIHRIDGSLRGWERRKGGWFHRRDEGFPLTVKGNARKYTIV